jgi:hypothetical protein
LERHVACIGVHVAEQALSDDEIAVRGNPVRGGGPSGGVAQQLAA